MLNPDIGVVPDRLYLLDTGMIFTSAQFAGTPTTTRYIASILLTADRLPLQAVIADRTSDYQAVAIQPGVKRQITSDLGRFVCLRLNPLHPQFRRFSQMPAPGMTALDRDALGEFDAALHAAYEGRLSPQIGASLFDGLAAAVARCLPPVQPADARVDRILRFTRDRPACTGHELSAAFGMSMSRMSHLFRDSAGLSMKTFLRWQRMYGAMQLIRRGLSLTEIALEAGFADLSHFGREFRETAGVSPSCLLNNAGCKIVNWREHKSLPLEKLPPCKASLRSGEAEARQLTQ